MFLYNKYDGFHEKCCGSHFFGKFIKVKGDGEFWIFWSPKKTAVLVLIVDLGNDSSCVVLIYLWSVWYCFLKLSEETQLKKASPASSFLLNSIFLWGEVSYTCSIKTGFCVCLTSKLELIFVNTIWTACFPKFWLSFKILHDTVIYGNCSFT